MSEVEKWLKEIQRERVVIERIIKEKEQMLIDLDERIKILKTKAKKKQKKDNL